MLDLAKDVYQIREGWRYDRKSLTLDARLGLDKYEIDEEQSHIQVDQERCKTCD